MFWRKLLLVFNVNLQASSGEDHSTSEMGDFVGDSSKEMEEDLRRYQALMARVHWFFSNLLVFGYVHDSVGHRFFHLPANAKWSFYVEVGLSETKGTVVCIFFVSVKASLPFLSFSGTFKGKSSPKTFFVYRPTLSKE